MKSGATQADLCQVEPLHDPLTFRDAYRKPLHRKERLRAALEKPNLRRTGVLTRRARLGEP